MDHLLIILFALIVAAMAAALAAAALRPSPTTLRAGLVALLTVPATVLFVVVAAAVT